MAEILVGLLVCVLATWRLTYFFVNEDGPWDTCLALRQEAGVYELGEDGRPLTNLGRLLSCSYCTSVWVAIFCMIWLKVFPIVLFPFAISGGAMLIERAIETGGGGKM